MIGRTIARYHITGKLGQGGMGTVWKANDVLLRRVVALKFLPESMSASPEARRRFLHEARAASALDHPGVAMVYDAGEAEGQMYMAVAHVEGESVNERAAREPLPIDEAVRIAASVAETLAYAHVRGVIHRDITSRNIMLAPDGRAVVVDFGLARHDGTSTITPTGTILGTAAYMAPEVVLGEKASASSDLYGLGVVLYEMLTGAPPFTGSRPEAVLYEIVHCLPAPPSSRRPEVPRQLDRIVLTAIAKQPDKRYQAGEEFSAALSALLNRGRGRTTGSAKHGPGVEPTMNSLPASKYLAVVPFKDASIPGATAVAGAGVGHGLAEIVSASLARRPSIHVIPPSAMGPQGAEDDLRLIAQGLGANLLLTGSVQRLGRKIRITYSLIDPQRGVQIAADTLDGTVSTLLAMQDQLVASVVRSLELQPGAVAASRRGLGDPAAHEHYLQALGYLQRYDNEASVDGAITLLEGLLETEGGSALLHAALGRAYLAKCSLTYEPRWEARAAAACRSALKLDPDLPEALVTLGDLHRETGRYKDAVRDYRRALELHPDNPEALVGLAAAYDRSREPEKAEQSFRKAIALRPNYWKGYNWLGVFYFRNAAYEKAARAWERVVELSPDNARGYCNLGGAYYHLGRHEEALAAYGRSLEIRPDASAYTSLGTVHFFLGDRARAVQMFEKAAALRPSDPTVWGNLGDAYRWSAGLEDKARGAFDQAIVLMRQKLQLNPKHGKSWVDLGDWLAKLARLDEAVEAVDRGLELATRDVYCMARAARVFDLAGDRARALEWLRRAVQSGYDTTELERDPDLANLRAEPDFQSIVKGRRAGPSGT
ncbi:MAG TPA: tetratricopeptide repeat protein [Candidatus Eisenbacteria bacterium]|jgi:serine/threonine-protein kinase